MASLVLVNESSQDISVAVRQDGMNRLFSIPAGGSWWIHGGETTPELEALHRSKKLKFTYQTVE